MTTAKNKAAAEKPAADTQPDSADTAKPSVPMEEHEAALARIKELEAALEQATAPTIVTAEPVAVPVLLDPPNDLPEGFVFHRVTGQQWCGQCAVAPLDPSATSFTCEHGSWQARTQTFTPDEI